VQAIVRRTNLVEALERAAAGRGTVISALAGSGKTYLLRERTTRRVAFVAVQRRERDAQRFWLSVLGAAHLGDPVSPSPEFDGEAAVERLVDELRRDGDPSSSSSTTSTSSSRPTRSRSSSSSSTGRRMA
jgi:ATP/maltotriose-dependent transcriptional regulator MalT